MKLFENQTSLIIGADIALITTVIYAVATLSCRITKHAVEVIMLGWCVRRIRLDDIEHVHRGGSLWNEHWTNFKLWNSVTLCRKSGWLRNFVVTPDDPSAFIDELKQKLEKLHERPEGR